jgi:hypothetical protein
MRAPETGPLWPTPKIGVDDRVRFIRLAWRLDEHELDGLDPVDIRSGCKSAGPGF